MNFLKDLNKYKNLSKKELDDLHKENFILWSHLKKINASKKSNINNEENVDESKENIAVKSKENIGETDDYWNKILEEGRNLYSNNLPQKKKVNDIIASFPIYIKDDSKKKEDGQSIDDDLKKAINASLQNEDEKNLQKAIISSLVDNDDKLKEKILLSLKTGNNLKTNDNSLLSYIDSVNEISKNKSKNNVEFIDNVMNNLLPNYSIHIQKADGACMFRSFEQILGIDHGLIREKTVDYICNNWDSYKYYCLNINGENFNSSDEYRKYMIKKDTWGNMPELNAICVFYCINVIVFDINKQNQKINITKIEQNDNQTIHLIYSHYNGNCGHYDIILP